MIRQNQTIYGGSLGGCHQPINRLGAKAPANLMVWKTLIFLRLPV